MDDDALQAAFAEQVGWCTRLDAPFTAALIGWLADDRARGGPVRALLPGWPHDPSADLVPLRLAGGLHALVLSGRHPALAALYPPAAFDAAALGPALHRLLVDEADHLRAWLASAPQTNETQRSAVLLGGYAEVARRTALPLALREIGASAGLNLLWDRFGYRLGPQRWGDAASPVQISADWRGNALLLPASIAVADRRANDLQPIDAGDAQAALRLRAYVWPDQPERAARLAGALRLAQTLRPAVDAGDAADWVERQLAAPTPGAATVLVHSIVWQYLPAATRARIEAAVQAAGARASAAAPLAWLRMEFFAHGAAAELRLALWPGGAETTLARAHPHGAWADWL
jgi:hypothetical protein